jgi:chromosome segregation and condensation protein ScpB
MARVFEEPKPSKDEIRNALNEIDENCMERGIELKSYTKPWLAWSRLC